MLSWTIPQTTKHTVCKFAAGGDSQCHTESVLHIGDGNTAASGLLNT